MPELFWFLLGVAATLVVTLSLLRWQRSRSKAGPEREPGETGAGPDPASAEARPAGAEGAGPRPIVLRESRSLEELSDSLGRDLATLATSVEGHAQLLCESIGQPKVIAAQAEQLWEAVRRLRFFSEKMQSFSQVPQLVMEPTRVDHLLSALALEIEDYSNGTLQVQLHLAPSLPMAMANLDALRTAVLFLIEGVIELEPQASTLQLQAQSYSDDGDEDAEEGADGPEEAGADLMVRIDIEAVLDGPVEVSEARRPEIQFSYLAARNLLRAQDARFTIDHCPGLNAVASITLRAAEAEQASEALAAMPQFEVVAEEPAPIHQFRGVLILEGNPTIRDMLTRELDRSVRNVINCADGLAARTLFTVTPERFELLILELESRRMRGDSLALWALEQCPDLSIVLLSPGKGARIKRELLSHPRLRVLHKPFGIMELRDSLMGLLGPDPDLAGSLGGPPPAR